MVIHCRYTGDVFVFQKNQPVVDNSVDYHVYIVFFHPEFQVANRVVTRGTIAGRKDI